jgi:hypothetical protein
MLFDGTCRSSTARRINHESLFDHRPSDSGMACISVDVAAGGCLLGGGGDIG